MDGRPLPAGRGRGDPVRAAVPGRRHRAAASRDGDRASSGAAPLEAACASVGRFARIDPDAAETPARGDDDAPAEAAGRPALDASFGLTDRELEVLRLLAQGLSNRRIGDTLFITESTAGVHVSNILGKLGVASRVEAAAIAVRVGLSD